MAIMTTNTEDQQIITVNGANILSEIYEEEVIIVNLINGCYYSIQGAGVFMWKAIMAGATASMIVKEVQSQYAGNADGILDASYGFITQLQLELLAVKTSGQPGYQPQPAPASPLPFVKPALEKYTDMQDLFLLDPIHEVDATGWPKQASPAETE